MNSFDEFYHCLVETLSSAENIDLRKCLNDYERIETIFNSGTLERLQFSQPCVHKSDIIANTYRKQGNDYLSKNNLKDALSFYTKALLSAESQEEKALCHGNKSMVLLELRYPREALTEIDKAIEHNFPTDKKVRLYIRAAECNRLLNRTDQCLYNLKLAESSLETDFVTAQQRATWLGKIARLQDKCNHTQRNEESLPIKSVQFTRPICPTITSANPAIPSASASISLIETQESGRGFIANRDIDIGEILFVERPYTSRLNVENFLTHCYTCMEPTFNMIPCDRCSLIGFCSRDCANAASLRTWPASPSEPQCGLGHYWECPLLHLLYPAQESAAVNFVTAVTSLKMVHLAISTIARTCPNTVIHTVQASRSSARPTFPAQPILSDDYSAAFNIVTNADKRTNRDLLARSRLAIFIMKLFKWCGYLNIDSLNHTGLTEREKEITLASALLTHLQALPCNAHDVSQQIMDLTTCPEPQELACAVYPCLSLINHSCDPNVIRLSMGRGHCQVRSLSVISAGEPILDNYSCHYGVMPLQERRIHLERQYLFTCACAACVYNYPSYEVAVQSDGQAGYQCLHCHRDLGSVTPPTCPHCGTDLSSIWSQLIHYRSLFPSYIADLVSPNQTAMDKVAVEDQALRYLRLLHAVVLKPGGVDYHQAGETLKMLWNCQGNTLIDPYRCKTLMS